MIRLVRRGARGDPKDLTIDCRILFNLLNMLHICCILGHVQTSYPTAWFSGTPASSLNLAFCRCSSKSLGTSIVLGHCSWVRTLV